MENSCKISDEKEKEIVELNYHDATERISYVISLWKDITRSLQKPLEQCFPAFFQLMAYFKFKQTFFVAHEITILEKHIFILRKIFIQ